MTGIVEREYTAPIKITDNVKSVLFGLLTLLLDGVIIMSLFALYGLDVPNAMFLLGIPYDWAPGWLNIYTIFFLSLLVVFAITAIYEEVYLEEKERWYNRIKANNQLVNEEQNIFK